ncbi:MAG: HlyD family efflux transporter periplasmic adaptor subunit, partial [Roseiflexaceae bacterium]|nr:HlyD family efflux transporter periplasmic adaptor subunit [Roseiflexaceae bacterium]
QRTGTLDAASAAIASARASYDLLLANPKQAELARAQAQVQQAEVALKVAQLALEDATLRAPSPGTVAEVNLTIGESPDAQLPAFVLASGEFQIETTDLTELQVVGIQPGNTVDLRFDALPDLALRGTVAKIETIGQRSQGDIIYTVVITPEQLDPRLRWNMTAAVSFPAE